MRLKPRHDLTEPRSWFAIFFSAGGVFAIFAAVALLVFTGISVWSYAEAQRFDREGIETTAVVIDRRIVRDSEGSNDYYATFSFEAGGKEYRIEKSVSRSFHRANPERSTSTIRYLRSNPRKTEHFVGENAQEGRVLQIIAGVAGLVALGLLWYFGQRTNRAVLARRWGRRTTATITGFVERKKSGKPTGKGYMIWNLADGTRGESLDRNIHVLRALGKGTEIIVYVRKGDSWWEGDVGPRFVPDSSIPKVSQDD